MDTVQNLINIPDLLCFFVPGFVFISFFNFLTYKKFNTDKVFIISVSLSFVMMSILNLVQYLRDKYWVKIFLSIILFIILAVICSVLYRKSNGYFEKFRISVGEDLILNLINDNEGCNIKVYLKGNEKFCILGHVKSYNMDQIALSAPVKVKIGSNEPLEKTKDDKVFVCWKENIEYIEIV